MVERTHEPDEPKLYRCCNCKRTLGICMPDHLQVGQTRFRKHVTFDCLSCGARNRWYPPGPR